MKNLSLTIAFFLIILNLFSQDIDDLLDAELSSGKQYTTATFKSTHIINSHSVAQMKEKHLNFLIYHRFGAVNGGINTFFGIDNANMRLALEYALTNNLSIGIGRTNFQKTYDGFIKYRMLRQSKGARFSSPITLSYLGSTEIISSAFEANDRQNYFSSRMSYIHQLLIARKFNQNLSVELIPTLIHRNLVKTAIELNDLPAIGIGGRYKLTKRMAVTFEYYKTFRSKNVQVVYHDPISIGLDIETGGHVFQLVLSNSPLMQEGGFISGLNNDSFLKGGIHFGFNITRVFSFDEEK